MEIIRILMSRTAGLGLDKSKQASSFRNRILAVFLAVTFICTLSSCSKKPAELYEEGMKAYIAQDYTKAQDDFARGIKKEGDTKLYAGFIAANLVTGKYPNVITAYNTLSDSIHSTLVRILGAKSVGSYGITSKIIPYKTTGGNIVPPDFPETIVLQATADFREYLVVKQQIENDIRK